MFKNACNFVSESAKGGVRGIQKSLRLSFDSKKLWSILPKVTPNLLYCLLKLYETESFCKVVDLEELDEFNDPAFNREIDDISEDFKKFLSLVLEIVETTKNTQMKDYFCILFYLTR